MPFPSRNPSPRAPLGECDHLACRPAGASNQSRLFVGAVAAVSLRYVPSVAIRGQTHRAASSGGASISAVANVPMSRGPQTHRLGAEVAAVAAAKGYGTLSPVLVVSAAAL